MSVRDPRDVLLSPVISEKSYGLIDSGQYTFIVLPEANKTQIKIAVEQIFNVKVLGVNTLNREGKRKRSRRGFGKRKDTKRAVVTVTPESRTIDVFGESPSTKVETTCTRPSRARSERAPRRAAAFIFFGVFCV